VDARRWQRVNDVFEAAIARTIDERPAFIVEAYAGDRELESRVRRLVRAHEHSVGFLEKPVASEALRVLALPEGSSGIELPLTAFRAGTAFRGTDRFVVRRQLGAGGMGVVYEVHDTVRNELVALKTLRRAHAADIYRLKREFRSLADIAHPNLVSLYELVVTSTDCFFTMELVNGVNLVEFLRDTATIPRLDYQQVRRVVRQLVDGIRALHRNGKLHRDIKPPNILITPAERVVILDFGLASDLISDDAAIGESMAGTPAYLAPERQSGSGPAESEDWYSVGVTLYEALTGRVPFEGTFEEVRRRKRESVPPPPRASVSGIPEDLNAICTGLLRSDPLQRLSGHQAAQMLEPTSAAKIETRPSEQELESTFVGRQRQLDVLESALAAAKQGTATTVYVHGPSGIGKSALVQHFLDRLESREDIVVLRGRCYEREAVPYKALDGVIDSLSQYLRTLPQWGIELLLPPNVAALFRLFPVMLQVGMAASGRRREREDGDPITVRDRAFGALRDLLTVMALQRPLVVYIDDLHWADDDSATLLEELLRPPQAPPILTIACFRAEEVESKPFLQKLLECARGDVDVSLPLEPMTDDEVRALVASGISAGTFVSGTDLARVAKDAGGNPFLLRQMAGYLATRRVGSGHVTFAEMLNERLRALPQGGRQFLETLAICGRAMAPELVHEAAGLVGDERPLVARLHADHLLRASGSASRVELYHDRIRETLAAGVSPDERRELHRSVAHTLVSRGADDPEALYEHYREAGNHEDASVQAALAAKKADAALAFDRAAAYYRAALELAPRAKAQVDWKQLMAAALANAGRPAEAADAYLDAAGEVQHTRGVELQRMAAEQLLIGGHIDRGLEVIRAVLGAVNLRFPRTPREALVSLAWRRLRLRWRGQAFVERTVDSVSPEELLRVDTCWSVTTGMAMVDNLPAFDFQSRHLLLALDTGEPYRIARALAAEAFFLASAGGPRRVQAHQWATRAEAVATHAGHPHAIAVCALARTASAFLVGDWPAAQMHGERALSLLTDQSVAATWEKSSAQVFRIGALLFQGELRRGSQEVPAILASARGRGNLYFETELRTRMNLVWLAADHPDEGLHEATEALRQWSHSGFHRQHYNYMLDRIQTELYRGRAREAWRVMDENWSALQRTYLLRIQFLRIEASYLRARCALAMAASGQEARRFLAIARRHARRIAREQMPWSDPLACLLSAAAAHLEGNPDTACDKLAEAASGFQRAHMNLYLAVARSRLGELARNDASRALGREADEWMAAQGVVNPPRITHLIAPGFDRRV
jgi:tRNA A-37 threonylcarbamoyl transferase component Bud32